jgi:hypothetical protein
MKTLLLRLEFFKNYLLQLPIAKKIFLSATLSFFVVLIYVKQYFPLDFIILVYSSLFICMYLFNTENQARKVCKIWIWLLILIGIYFIMLNSQFFKKWDDFWEVPALATSEHQFNILAIWNYIHQSNVDHSRFMPLYATKFQVLAMFAPYGYTAFACYMLNALLFAILILMLAKILDFKSKQKVVFLYIKLFSIISFPFIANPLLEIFSVITFSDVEVCVYLVIFLFAYKKISYPPPPPVALRSCEIKYGINVGDKKVVWIIVAIFSAILATYSKESAFSIFLIIAITNFLLNSKAMKKEDKIFNFILIWNAILFLILYYALEARMASNFYNGVGSNFLTFSLRPFLNIPILILVVIFGVFRFYFVFVKKSRTYIFYDSILFSCVGIVIVYEMLGRFSPRFYVLAVILFVSPLCFWLCYLYDRRKYFFLFILYIFIVYVSIVSIGGIKEGFERDRDPGAKVVYNLLKIDRFFSREIIANSVVKVWCLNLLDYVHNYIENLDEIENKEQKKLRFSTMQGEVDKKMLYIADTPNLPEDNENFKDFVMIAEQTVVLNFYAYAHKDRL